MEVKRITALLLVLLFLSGCSPSKPDAEMQAQIDQFNEWQAQVEEIAPLLEAPLYDTYDIDISVYQISGKISAKVEVLSSNVSRYSFGIIIGLCGERFLELVEEHSNYSFDKIVFVYYCTNLNGKKYSDTSDISYTLYSDGSSTFLEPNGDIIGLFDKSPMDIYYLLTGNSPE